MSLSIDINTVAAVLLADGWHTVEDWSFGLDAYEFLWSGNEDTLLEQVKKKEYHSKPLLFGPGGLGFHFTEKVVVRDRPISVTCLGPLSSILAVRCVRR